MKKLLLIFIAALLLCGCSTAKRTAGGALIKGADVSSAQPGTYFIGDKIPGRALIYTAAGEVFYAEDYKITEKLTGVITDPPEATVMDAAKLAKEYLDAGEKVLMIFIDGLGWYTFLSAREQGDIPCLASLEAREASSVYPTITPVNYAAMVSGEPPAVSGVTKRGIHEIQCETIFTYAEAMGLESYVSEGDTQILRLEGTETELSPDLNGSGSGDDEILDCALERIAAGGCALVFVHFHSVDDAEHEYSPGSAEAREALKTVDSYCAKLLESWDGRVIIVADHGQHAQDGTGDAAYADRRGTHGDFAPTDIFVPLLTGQGG